MKHDELQDDLAAQLRGNTDRMVWTNTQLGPSGSPRPDVFTVDKSYARFSTDAYEIKVSVSDLRRDVTSGKWQSYRAFAHRVWFAFPRGMVSADEIPRECGIITRGDAGWRAARKPIAQVLDTLPRDAWLKLLIESSPASAVGHRTEPRAASQWRAQQAIREKLGDEVAELFYARKSADASYEIATQRRKDAIASINKEVERMRECATAEALRQQTRLDGDMRGLGHLLGMADDEITAKNLSARLCNLYSAIEGSGIDRAINQLNSLQSMLQQQREATV